jgi:hypothetical protein
MRYTLKDPQTGRTTKVTLPDGYTPTPADIDRLAAEAFGGYGASPGAGAPLTPTIVRPTFAPNAGVPPSAVTTDTTVPAPASQNGNWLPTPRAGYPEGSINPITGQKVGLLETLGNLWADSQVDRGVYNYKPYAQADSTPLMVNEYGLSSQDVNNPDVRAGMAHATIGAVPAAARGALMNTLPAVGAFAGGTLGTLTGIPGGGLVGGLGGGIGTSYLQDQALRGVLSPKDYATWQDQLRRDREEFFIQSELGAISPFGLTNLPAATMKEVIPAFGLGYGLNVGQQAVHNVGAEMQGGQGQPLDWGTDPIASGLGMTLAGGGHTEFGVNMSGLFGAPGSALYEFRARRAAEAQAAGVGSPVSERRVGTSSALAQANNGVPAPRIGGLPPEFERQTGPFVAPPGPGGQPLPSPYDMTTPENAPPRRYVPWEASWDFGENPPEWTRKPTFVPPDTADLYGPPAARSPLSAVAPDTSDVYGPPAPQLPIQASGIRSRGKARLDLTPADQVYGAPPARETGFVPPDLSENPVYGPPPAESPVEGPALPAQAQEAPGDTTGPSVNPPLSPARPQDLAPWEMTGTQWRAAVLAAVKAKNGLELTRLLGGVTRNQVTVGKNGTIVKDTGRPITHEMIVAKAVAAGYPVPPEIAAEYPLSPETPFSPTGEKTNISENATPNQESPTGFQTAKGSEYTVTENGTTIRNKAARDDFDHAGDSGVKPETEYTVYVSPENAEKLGLFQTRGGKKSLVRWGDNNVGVRFDDGPNAGKVARTSATTFETHPRVGLMPVEVWNSGSKVHFGNEITRVDYAPSGTQGEPPNGSEGPQEGQVGGPRFDTPGETTEDLLVRRQQEREGGLLGAVRGFVGRAKRTVGEALTPKPTETRPQATPLEPSPSEPTPTQAAFNRATDEQAQAENSVEGRARRAFAREEAAYQEEQRRREQERLTFERERAEGDARREAIIRGEGPPRFDTPEHQTHTEPFLRWFGDWQGAPEKASKIVDETGKPKVVYHGTSSEFSEFRGSASGPLDRMLGPHFAADPEVSNAFTSRGYAKDGWREIPRSYAGDEHHGLLESTDPSEAGYAIKPGGRTLPVYLDMKNPLVIAEGKGFDQNAIAREVGRDVFKRRPDLFRRFVESLGIDPKSDRGKDMLSDVDKAVEDYIPNPSDTDLRRDMVREFVKNSGYDGIIYKNTSPTETKFNNEPVADRTSYIVFKPEQVKSATGNSGEFSRESRDIRFETGEPTAGEEQPSTETGRQPEPIDRTPRIAKDAGEATELFQTPRESGGMGLGPEDAAYTSARYEAVAKDSAAREGITTEAWWQRHFLGIVNGGEQLARELSDALGRDSTAPLPRGQLERDELGRYVITALANPSRYTALHELGHIVLEQLTPAEREVVGKHLGADLKADGSYDFSPGSRGDERFALAVERMETERMKGHDDLKTFLAGVPGPLRKAGAIAYQIYQGVGRAISRMQPGARLLNPEVENIIRARFGEGPGNETLPVRAQKVADKIAATLSPTARLKQSIAGMERNASGSVDPVKHPDTYEKWGAANNAAILASTGEPQSLHEFTRELTSRFGEELRPQAESLYNGARQQYARHWERVIGKPWTPNVESDSAAGGEPAGSGGAEEIGGLPTGSDVSGSPTGEALAQPNPGEVRPEPQGLGQGPVPAPGEEVHPQSGTGTGTEGLGPAGGGSPLAEDAGGRSGSVGTPEERVAGLRMVDIEDTADLLQTTLPDRKEFVEHWGEVQADAKKNFTRYALDVRKAADALAANKRNRPTLTRPQRLVAQIMIEDGLTHINDIQTRLEDPNLSSADAESLRSALTGATQDVGRMAEMAYRANSEMGRTLGFLKSIASGPFDAARYVRILDKITNGKYRTEAKEKIILDAAKGQEAQRVQDAAIAGAGKNSDSVASEVARRGRPQKDIFAPELTAGISDELKNRAQQVAVRAKKINPQFQAGEEAATGNARFDTPDENERDYFVPNDRVVIPLKVLAEESDTGVPYRGPRVGTVLNTFEDETAVVKTDNGLSFEITNANKRLLPISEARFERIDDTADRRGFGGGLLTSHETFGRVSEAQNKFDKASRDVDRFNEGAIRSGRPPLSIGIQPHSEGWWALGNTEQDLIHNLLAGRNRLRTAQGDWERYKSSFPEDAAIVEKESNAGRIGDVTIWFNPTKERLEILPQGRLLPKALKNLPGFRKAANGTYYRAGYLGDLHEFYKIAHKALGEEAPEPNFPNSIPARTPAFRRFDTPEDTQRREDFMDSGTYLTEAGFRRRAQWDRLMKQHFVPDATDAELDHTWETIKANRRATTGAARQAKTMTTRANKSLDSMENLFPPRTSATLTKETVVPLAVQEYAQGAKDLTAVARRLKAKYGDIIPDDVLQDAFTEAVQEYKRLNKPVRDIQLSLARTLADAANANKHPLQIAAEVVRAGLLSNPHTVAVINTSSHASRQIFESLSRTPQAMADIARLFVRGAASAGGMSEADADARFGPGYRTVANPNLLADFEAIHDGFMKQGLREGADIMRGREVENDPFKEEDLANALGMHGELGMDTSSKNPVASAFAKSLNAYTSTIYRSHEATYRPFRIMAFKRAIADTAWLAAQREAFEAKQQGLAPVDVRARATELKASPTSEMQAAAVAFANEMTYLSQNKITGLVAHNAKHLNTILAEDPRLARGATEAIRSLLLPVSTVPVNAALHQLEGVTGAPRAAIVGLKNAILKKSTPEEAARLAKTFGRGVTGIGLLAFGYWLSDRGLVTGHRETKKDYLKSEKEGAPGESFYSDGAWHRTAKNYFWDMITTGADIAEEAAERAAKGEKVNPAFDMLVAPFNPMVIQKSVHEMPFSNVVNKAADFNENKSRVMGDIAGELIPSFVAEAGNYLDPYKRQVPYNKGMETFTGAIQKRVPVLREKMEPRKANNAPVPQEKSWIAPGPLENLKAIGQGTFLTKSVPGVPRPARQP